MSEQKLKIYLSILNECNSTPVYVLTYCYFIHYTTQFQAERKVLYLPHINCMCVVKCKYSEIGKTKKK